MEIVLTEKDKAVTESLIQTGYDHAASSFAAMVGQKVQIKSESIEMFSDPKEVMKIISDKEHHTIVLTELIGELHGESYLIFNEYEKKTIYELCMQAFSVGAGSSLDDVAILKEVDNILSAAVITQFSNRLKIRIFGDVPKLFTHDNILRENLFDKHDDCFILSNAHFAFDDHVELSPKFLWKLDDDFLHRTRSLRGETAA